jgi:hypothetical protein
MGFALPRLLTLLGKETGIAHHHFASPTLPREPSATPVIDGRARTSSFFGSLKALRIDIRRRGIMLKLAVAVIALTVSHHAAHAQAMRWVQTKTAVSPSGRPQAFMAYDAARQKIVLYQESWSVSPSETWTLEGKVWSLERPSKSPPGVSAMAYDAARRETVLFMHRASKGETWVWDGKNWTERSTTSFPISQSGHAIGL